MPTWGLVLLGSMCLRLKEGESVPYAGVCIHDHTHQEAVLAVLVEGFYTLKFKTREELVGRS